MAKLQSPKITGNLMDEIKFSDDKKTESKPKEKKPTESKPKEEFKEPDIKDQIPNNRHELASPSNVGKWVKNKEGNWEQITPEINKFWQDKIKADEKDKKEKGSDVLTNGASKTDTTSNDNEKIDKDAFVGGIINAYKSGLFGDKNSKQAKRTLAYYILDKIGSAMMSAGSGSIVSNQWSKDREGLIQNRIEAEKKQLAPFSRAEEKALQEQINSLEDKISDLRNQKIELQEALNSADTTRASKVLSNVRDLVSSSIGQTGASTSQSDSSSANAQANAGIKGFGVGGGFSVNEQQSNQNTQSFNTYGEGTIDAINSLIGELGNTKPVATKTINGKTYYKSNQDLVRGSLISNWESLSKEEKDAIEDGWTSDIDKAEIEETASSKNIEEQKEVIRKAIKQIDATIERYEKRINELRSDIQMIRGKGQDNQTSNNQTSDERTKSAIKISYQVRPKWRDK